MMDIVHHNVELDDVRIHYVTAGSGPPLVLLHGWPQTWFMWRDVIPRLAAHFALVVPDLRGLGDSSRPETGYDKATVARDIAELMTRGRGLTALESWGRVANGVTGGVADGSGHWIPEERPDFVAAEVMRHFVGQA